MANKIYVYNKGSKNINNQNTQNSVCRYKERLNIADCWFILSENNEYKKEIMLIGCKIVFKYKGNEYHLFSQSPNEYENSFKCFIPLIIQLLEDIGATNINYRVGKPK